ncbi:high affinity copper transporter [Histoplasma ohiense]|uniref:Copper transport protein n=1 Tax=Ajellomyces capsulatus TaxID=5037 RepID=Q1HRW7_AJECA|nr:putative high affinity copper transporter [Histoplasma capsulatum]KAG5291399.1 high affinity copper transporter [Histoplasma ohiense (nom. inval.)]
MDMKQSMSSGAPMPTPSAAANMSGMKMGSSMGGMHMGGMGNGCKISMLWNWTVLNACFVSSQWRITSTAMFVGSCIGVILLVMLLQFLRRASYEFDRYVAGKSNFYTGRLQRVITSPKQTSPGLESPTEASANAIKRPLSRSLLQHTAKSMLFTMQFGLAYFIMLLAMYYNGFIYISILIGAFLGSFVFTWNTDAENDASKVTVCCG